ncbi:hypothetical protein [Kribbella sp. NPDC051770]|uniref:hypothetical protein n=1 Tax=Kribbella sp. NPDC051770 TaxID=3155413 RepID=UPI0034294541
MRFLPDKPSLGFLRKEAKDLLAALRESRPGTSLTEAQQALAIEYGVRDWAALRSEVERRAADVPKPPDGLADALAAAFGLGRVSGEVSPVSLTPMGRCWSITTDRGRWLAVTVYPWITNEQAEIGTRLRDAAVARGVAAPTPVRSPAGRLIDSVREQSWRVHEWIEVGPSPVSPTPTGVARAVGTTYGILHSLAIPSATPVNPYLTARGDDAQWDDLVAHARRAGKPWADELAALLPIVGELRTIEASLDGDLILCNCVVIPENVRIGHHDELVVTEWDFAGSLTVEQELGAALGHWALRPELNRTALAGFREGYVDATGNWPDLELSSFVVGVTGWLNWTYNTVCEAIDPSDPDRTAFIDHEVADLLARPMTRRGLQQLLEG